MPKASTGKNQILDHASFLVSFAKSLFRGGSVMRNFILCSVACFWLSPVLHGVDMLSPKGLQYGYKTANLMLMQEQLLKTVKASNEFLCQIPAFVALSGNMCEEIVQQQGVNLRALWSQATTERQDTGSTVFDRLDALANSVEQLSGTLPAQQPTQCSEQLTQFIEKAQQEGWRLMVRSSGLHEDTDALSNAGGNESEANVSPDFQSFVKALNKVVASYFRSKSIMQRMVAGDSTALAEFPGTPVLVQHMTGEQVNGAQNSNDIPVGCVVYTQEPYGNTPGVMLIQASFGHNTGVVDSKVAIDSYFVDDQDHIFSLIKQKTQRLVPSFDGQLYGLEVKANPTDVQNIPALDDVQVAVVAQLARSVWQFYHKPMDLELVVDRAHKIVYIVQARPLQLVGGFKPQYIKFFKNLASRSSCLVVNADDCSVKHITAPSQVIVAKTLEDALTIFNKPDFDKSSIQAVIVEQQAESTSHAAAIFRGAGKLIIIANDIETVKKWLAPLSCSVFIDVQTGYLMNALPEDITIVKGFFKHPAPAKLSICSVPLIADKQHTDYFPEDTEPELFEKLNDAEEHVAIHALDSILCRMKNFTDMVIALKNDPLKGVVALEASRRLSLLYAQARQLAECIRPKLALPARDITRLFVTNFFSALYWQEISFGSVATDSFAAIKKLFEQEVAFIEKFKNDSRIFTIVSDRKLFTCACQGCALVLTPELEKTWIDFVAANAHKPEFGKVYQIVQACGMLSLFVNIYVNARRDQGPDSILQDVFVQIEEHKAFLQELIAKRTALEAFDFSVWEDPLKFTEQLESFDKDFTTFFTGRQHGVLIAQKTTSPFMQLVAQGVMEKFVDVFDTSIKTLKGSRKYSTDSQKVVNFKKMLSSYCTVLTSWAPLVPERSFEWSTERIHEYCKSIQEKIGQLSDGSEQLTTTPNFGVANMVIGKALVSVLSLTRGEEVYTLIHQNLLIILGIFFTQHIDQEVIEKFSPLLKKVHTFLVGFNGTLKENDDTIIKLTSFLLGICFNNDGLRVRYNIPLRDHSLVCDLHFDCCADTVYLTLYFVSFLGYRWPSIEAQAYLDSLQNTRLPKLQGVCTVQDALELEYCITEESDLALFGEVVQRFINQTLDDHFITGPDFLGRFCKPLCDLLIKNSPTNPQLYSCLQMLLIDNFDAYKDIAFAAVTQGLGAINRSPLTSYRKGNELYDVMGVLIKNGYAPAYEYMVKIGGGYVFSEADLSESCQHFSMLYSDIASIPQFQPDILQLAEHYLASGDCRQLLGVLLYSDLVKNKYKPAYERALARVRQKALQESPYRLMNSKIIELLKALFGVNIGFAEGFAIAQQCYNANPVLALEIYCLLAEGGPVEYFDTIYAATLQNITKAPGLVDGIFESLFKRDNKYSAFVQQIVDPGGVNNFFLRKAARCLLGE